MATDWNETLNGTIPRATHQTGAPFDLAAQQAEKIRSLLRAFVIASSNLEILLNGVGWLRSMLARPELDDAFETVHVMRRSFSHHYIAIARFTDLIARHRATEHPDFAHAHEQGLGKFEAFFREVIRAENRPGSRAGVLQAIENFCSDEELRFKSVSRLCAMISRERADVLSAFEPICPAWEVVLHAGEHECWFDVKPEGPARLLNDRASAPEPPALISQAAVETGEQAGRSLIARIPKEGQRRIELSDVSKPKAGTEIIYYGDLLYGTDVAEPVTVAERDHDVLQAFLAIGPMDMKRLKKQSTCDSAVSVLRRLTKKFEGIFACAIKFPGAKRSGGYSVKIRQAHQTAHQTAHK